MTIPKHPKEKIIEESAELIDALLYSGHDEDAHLWNFSDRTISGEDIIDLLQDFDAFDLLMLRLQPAISRWLNKSAEDYIKEAKKKK